MPLSSRYRIRATRASPPGLASEEARRETYGAALAQFDELMEAADANSPAARPLPLFYALSQAGRAIAAAHADHAWRLRMHGLTAPDLDGPLLSVAVKRTSAEKQDSIDSFTGVANASRSPLFSERADIQSLWASLPEVVDLLASPPEVAPLLLVPEDINVPVKAWPRLSGVIVGFRGEPDDLPSYLEEHFPTAAGVSLLRFQGLPSVPEHHTDYGPGYSVWWPAEAPNFAGHLRTLQRVAPGAEHFGPQWLRPSVSGVALSPLMTWWALLFALSMVARYEPAGWMAALDYDHSGLAAPLAQLLDTGLDQVPELVLDALIGAPSGDGHEEDGE